MVTEDRPLQPLNAPYPIEVTELGISISTSPLQSLNALLAMPFVPSRRVIDVFAGIVPLYL